MEGKGRVTLWIDPTHGYQAAKVRVHLRPGDDVGGNALKPNNSNETILEVTEFQKIDDIWCEGRSKSAAGGGPKPRHPDRTITPPVTNQNPYYRGLILAQTSGSTSTHH